MPWLINASQLEKIKKGQKNVIVLDASWHLPAENIDARLQFNQRHITQARFLDLNLFHDSNSATPNMLSHDMRLVAEKIGELGITNEHKIIFYDNSKCHASCRALWMFKVFGHNPFQLYILDGGIEAWEHYGGKIENDEPKEATFKIYNVNYQKQWVRTLQEMKQNLLHPKEQVIDVRHPVRFAGGKETRPHLRAGHIPNSFCFPYFTMYEADGKLKPLDKIKKQLLGISVELSHPVISTCGSGMTAPILDFVLDLLNHENHAVYDGSWSEWGVDTLYPGEASLSERQIETVLDE